MLHVLLVLLLQDAEQLAHELSSEDLTVRESATDALIKGGASSIPTVSKLMESRDPEVVGRAEAILMRIGLPGVSALESTGSKKLRKIAATILQEKAREFLNDDETYTVQWNEPPSWDHSIKVEAGTGSGHGFTLAWTDFQPKGEKVEVLTVTYNRGRKPYNSKWPPDDAPLEVTNGEMKGTDYQIMLRVLAAIGEASITTKETNFFSMSSADFYSFARITRDDRELFSDEFAGYRGTSSAPAFAKVNAMTSLIQATLKAVDLKAHALGKDERLWVSQRFIRDWKRIGTEKQFYWWVRERLLVLVGVSGDESALPLLTEIIRAGDPKERTTYYAINAATRLLGKDVREKPVEEMDIEVIRRRLLPLLEKR